MSTSTTHQFPSRYPFAFGLKLSLERRAFNGAMNGIRISEHMIRYYTEKMAEHTELADLILLSNTIVGYQLEIAEHRTVLAGLPAME